MRTLIITATILVPTAAFAGGYLVPSMNPRDLALGGSAVADETGPEATFLNTADLSSQQGLAIGFALAPLANNRTDWSDPTLGSSSLSQNAAVPALAISYGEKLPYDQAWGIGIGFDVAGGGTLIWPNGWAGRETIQSVKTQVFGFGGGAAFQLLPYFRFGLNYVRYQANQELHTTVNFLDHNGDAGFGLAGGGNTIGVGAEIVPPQVPIKIGVTYRHSSTLGFTGHIHFTDVPPAFQPALHDQPISVDFLMPDVVSAGVAFEAMPGLKLMGQYSFEHWSQYTKDDFVGTGGFETVIKRNWNDEHVIGIAGEWSHMSFLPQLTARAGVMRTLANLNTDTLAPTITDASRWALSIGAGYDVMPRLRVDVGYQRQMFDSATTTGMDAFPGTYKTTVDFLSLGVSWRTDLRSAPAK